MSGKSTLDSPPTEAFKALSDPIRWNIIGQIAQVDELACLTLERTLPVSKPTISYHIKILHNAGLISTRKAGRNYYYSLRRDVLRDLLDGLWELAPMPRPVESPENKAAPPRRRRKRSGAARFAAVPRQAAVDEAEEEVAVLTW
jgi:DNA-binding transcriptional ArsR family regulator